jgi:BirA family transcriptional regulator, biotin operon repressor / biotin---[acetyl-CoA-carboxylase] ligase
VSSEQPWRLRELAECASTQDLALKAAADGEPDRLAIRADCQSAGRGRDARGWASAPGNLHLSVLLRPDAPAATLPLWGLLAGVALADTAAAHARGIALKWPNDLLRDGAKAGGILVDSASDGARIAHLVIGFGVNLAHAPPLPDRATAALGVIPPGDFAAALLARLDAWRARFAAEGAAPLIAAWLAFGPVPGSALTLRQPQGTQSARFAGLAADGRLLIETPTGPCAVASAEVLHAARH